jgi:hypothetical protein
VILFSSQPHTVRPDVRALPDLKWWVCLWDRYNYPFFLSMLATFIYIPACWLYVMPVWYFGKAITPEQTSIPRRKFAVGWVLLCSNALSLYAAPSHSRR